MNKKFLGLLILPALTLAACSDSGYKKVKYLNVDGTELVQDRGTPITYASFATYKLKAENLTDLRESYANFPESFVLLWGYFTVDPNDISEPTKYAVPDETKSFAIAGDFYSLELVAGSSFTAKSYKEYLYKPSAKSIKVIEHRYEGFPGEVDYYPNGVSVNVKPEATLPTSEYELYGSLKLKDETLETYRVLGEDEYVQYALEK